jgi:hypothetical protein
MFHICLVCDFVCANQRETLILTDWRHFTAVFSKFLLAELRCLMLPGVRFFQRRPESKLHFTCVCDILIGHL